MDVREILIPGRSMALAGRGMDGKTLMLIELSAAALKRAGSSFPPRVVVVASKSLSRCFRAEFGEHAHDIEFIEPNSLDTASAQNTRCSDPEVAFSLLERIARLHRPNLIVLESIDLLIGTGNPTRATFERLMRQLSELASRVHTAVLTVEPNISDVVAHVEVQFHDKSDSLKTIHEGDASNSQWRLRARLERWLARGELPAQEIMRRTLEAGFSLIELEQVKRELGIRSYVRLSEGARRRVWRLRD